MANAITVIDKATGAVRRLDVRGAKILIALGKAELLPLVEDGAPAYQTRAMTAGKLAGATPHAIIMDEVSAPAKRGPGRPRKALSGQ